ncbi:MAG: right-handed parallel beta-helix repeat-containing protein [Bacteroidia bacterium]|nr:right-handed parallel beta-helix repeat-containing protein [Bacteroidia bacterium]
MKKSVLFLFALAVSLQYLIAQGTTQDIGEVPGISGGFEDMSATPVSDNTAFTSGKTYWTRWDLDAYIYNSTGGRSGPKYMTLGESSSTSRLRSSTTGSDHIASNTQYVYQFYYKNTGNTNNLQVYLQPDGSTTLGTGTNITAGNTSGVWTKTTGTVTSKTATPGDYGHFVFRFSGASANNISIDDVCIYQGSQADETAPGDPTDAVVDMETPFSLFVQWSAPAGGVDGGGYMVVRGTADPQTAPNANGIYATGNAIGSGTVVYIGASTSFTDNGLSANTAYYYRVYALDKAFNYSGAVTANGATKAITTDDYRFNTGSGEWTVSSNWLKYNGSSWVTAVSYPGASTDNVYITGNRTVYLDGNPSCNNLVISGGALLYDNNTTRSLTVYGDLENSGALRPVASENTYGQSTVKTHTLTVKGSLVNYGTIKTATDRDGTDTYYKCMRIHLKMEGGGNASLTNKGIFDLRYNLTVNKTNVSDLVTLGSDITMADFTLTDNPPEPQLVLTKGKLVLGDYNFTLQSGGSINHDASPAANSYAATTGAGMLIKNFSATGSFTFPTGDASYYTPFTITLNSATLGSNAAISARVINSIEPHISGISNYINRYWDVSATDITGINADVSYIYAQSDTTGDENNFSAMRWTETEGYTTIGTVDINTNTSTANNITHLGNFTNFSYNTCIQHFLLNQPPCNLVGNGNFDDNFQFFDMGYLISAHCVNDWSEYYNSASSAGLTDNYYVSPYNAALFWVGGTSSIYTCLYSNILAGKSYILLFDVQGLWINSNITFSLANSSTSGLSCEYNSSSTLSSSQITNSLLIATTATTAASGSWAYQCIPFTVANNYDQLAISISSSSGGEIHLDDVGLYRTDIDDKYINCYGSVNIGICDIPGANYSWVANPPSGTLGATSSITVAPLITTAYTLTITAPNCTITSSATVYVNSTFTLNTSSTPECTGLNNGTATVTTYGGTGPFTYLWSNNGTTATINNLSAGIYTVTVTETGGCQNTASVTVTEDLLSASISNHTDVSCWGGNDGTATVLVTDGTPPYTINWSSGVSVNGYDVTGLSAVNVFVTVTDNNGCTSITYIAINQPAPLVADISSHHGAPCNAGNNGDHTGYATVAGAGTLPYTYLWSTTPPQYTAYADLYAGVNTVTITDAHGCMATTNVTITEPALLIASITSQTNELCYDGSTGSATVAASGGTQPYYYYIWNTTPLQNTTTASNLAAGIYTVTVTDHNYCTATTNVTITEPAQLVVSSYIITDNTCSCIGSIQVTVTGGYLGETGYYGYTWSTGSHNPGNISGLCADNYSVTVGDDNGCTVSQNFVVNDNIQCCTGCDYNLGTNPNWVGYSSAIFGTGNITVSNQTICLYGTLHINNANITFTGCTFNMGEHARIEIDYQYATTLTIDGTTIQACHDKWDWISVPAPSCTLNVVNGSLIKDAHDAIIATGGGVINIVGTLLSPNNFTNNDVSIYIHDYNPINYVQYPADITYNSFSDVDMNNIGILIENIIYSNVVIQSSNTFTQLEKGIMVSECTGISINPDNEFYNCNYGIHFQNQTHSGELFVTSCKFQECSTAGIWCYVLKSVDIETSQFYDINNNGIDLTDCQALTINDNEFLGISRVCSLK